MNTAFDKLCQYRDSNPEAPLDDTAVFELVIWPLLARSLPTEVLNDERGKNVEHLCMTITKHQLLSNFDAKLSQYVDEHEKETAIHQANKLQADLRMMTAERDKFHAYWQSQQHARAQTHLLLSMLRKIKIDVSNPRTVRDKLADDLFNATNIAATLAHGHLPSTLAHHEAMVRYLRTLAPENAVRQLPAIIKSVKELADRITPFVGHAQKGTFPASSTLADWVAHLSTILTYLHIAQGELPVVPVILGDGSPATIPRETLEVLQRPDGDPNGHD